MVKVYFEHGTLSEHVATFADEEVHMACLPALEQLAKEQGYTDVTESIES